MTYLNSKSKSFSGLSLVQDWQGGFLKGFLFNNGTGTYLVQGQQQSTKANSSIKPNDEIISVTTCFYEDDYVDGEYVGTEDLGCYTQAGAGGGEWWRGRVWRGGTTVSVTDYDYMSSGNPDDALDTIKITLTRKCYTAAWNSIVEGGLSTSLEISSPTSFKQVIKYSLSFTTYLFHSKAVS